MPKIEVVLTGDKKLNRKLKKLTGKDQKKVVRKATRKAIKPIQKQAKQNIRSHRESGKLEKSIKVRAVKRTRRGIGVRVTTGRAGNDFDGETFYGAFVEYGHKTGARGSSGRRDVKALRFMANAAKTERRRVIKIYREEIRAGIKQLTK